MNQSADPSASQRLACHILVQEHYPRLLAYAHALYAGIGRPHDHDAAEDLLQESLLTALDNLQRYDVERGFAAWVRGIMRHRFLKLARNREYTVDAPVLQALADTYDMWERPDAEGDLDIPADEHTDDQDPAQRALSHCLQALAEDARRTVEAFYFAGRAVYDIADHQGVSIDVVKKRLQRARHSLARCIQHQLSLTPAARPRSAQEPLS